MKRAFTYIFIAAAALLLSGQAFASGRSESDKDRGPIFAEPAAVPVVEDAGIGTLVEMQNSFRSVAQKVLPVVVEVDTVNIVTQTTSRQSPFGFFFRQPDADESAVPREFRRSGLGSGVIIYRSNGSVYVLTNHHVAGDAEEITVTLSDGRKFDGELVGSDAKRDLALVVFNTKEDIPVAETGDSDTLMVGDWVLAIGNPYGFESTVTAGIVSAIGRETTDAGGSVAFTDYIQTDAAINQGNSGGALVNIYGQLVGINTWIASPSGGNIGIGFAIPINNAKKVVEDLIRDGEIQYGWLGITVGDASPLLRDDLALGDESGGFVFGVIENSPAEKAGILAGDYITKIAGNKVKGRDDLIVTVGNIAPKTTVDFQVLRDGSTFTTPVTIAVRDDERISSNKDKIWPGFSAVTLTDEIRERMEIAKDKGNIVVGDVSEGSSAAEEGVRIGDIISSINGDQMENISDLYRIINDPGTNKYELLLNRQDEELEIEIRR
jgi:Do/DeqQ family serine protease